MLEVAREHSCRADALACLLIRDGLKVSEALRLTTGDVCWIEEEDDPRAALRALRKGGTSPSGLQVVPAPLAAATVAALDRLLGTTGLTAYDEDGEALADLPPGPLLTTTTGNALTTNGAYALLDRLAIRAGVARLNGTVLANTNLSRRG